MVGAIPTIHLKKKEEYNMDNIDEFIKEVERLQEETEFEFDRILDIYNKFTGGDK